MRVLHHTRGVILSDIALKTESVEVARRRLVQAEGAFRHTISLAPKDEYGYQSLAELYFGWAKRAETEGEAAEYLRKCEEVVTDGLRQVRVREGLWVVSAQIAEWLGDHPGTIEALEEAIASTPGGVVARSMLGRLYLRQGAPQKTIDLLQPVIEQSPEEVRSCLLYASAQYQLGASLPECIATLRLCSAYGFRYPRYIATLAGLLFLARDFTEAERLFEEGRSRGFGAAESYQVHFEALNQDRTGPMRLRGSVTHVRPGYAFIRSPDLQTSSVQVPDMETC